MSTPHVPKSTFISNYMEYMQDQETPVMYDFACACWILSNVLGRNVIVDRPRAPVHLNMYVILVSESGIMRKSTSIRHATSVLRDFYDQTDNRTMLVESKTSAGAMLNELHFASQRDGSSQMVFVASELAASFGRAAGMANMVALLTDLYDCPDVRTGGGTLTRQYTLGQSTKINLQNVYISFLGGTTPSWLERAITPTIIEGGFTSRCYFVVGKQRKRSIAWPDSQQDSGARQRLVDQLKEIKNESLNIPRIGINSRGLATFKRWYETRLIHRDAYRESFESREDSHILRYAAIFAVNERHWLINDDHIRRAIDVVGNVKSDGAGLFTGTDIKVVDLKWIKKLRTVLLAAEHGISRADLTKLMDARSTRRIELQSTIKVMHELDLITVEEHFRPDGGPGRPKTVYKPTIYLRNDGLLDDVTRKLGLDS